MTPRWLPLPALLLVACAHSDPSVTEERHDQPFAVGDPLRLTYDPGNDRTPVWAQDAKGFLYAFDADSQPDNVLSGCVAALPISGGTRGTTYCERDPAIVNAKEQMRPYWPARRGDGDIAYVQKLWKTIIPGLNPFESRLVLQPKDPGFRPTLLLHIPYFFAPTGRSHSGISHTAWLDDHRLIFLGRNELRSTNDVVNSGQEIVLFNVDLGTAGLSLVPGTTYASSVSVGATSDTIYYTLLGDSMVYRQSLSSGVVDTVYDFGALGIVRDAMVRNGKLVARVGGSVSFRAHVNFGEVQDDFGGPIYAVSLPAGTPVLLTNPGDDWDYVALAPDGQHAVGVWVGDLWRLAVP